MNEHTHRFTYMGQREYLCQCGATKRDQRTDEQWTLDRSIATLRHKITVNALMNAPHANLDAQLADLVAKRASLR